MTRTISVLMAAVSAMAPRLSALSTDEALSASPKPPPQEDRQYYETTDDRADNTDDPELLIHHSAIERIFDRDLSPRKNNLQLGIE